MTFRFMLPLAGLAVVAIGGNAQQPASRVPNSPGEQRPVSERQGKLKPGDVAADFNLNVMHSQRTVQLSSFKNRSPVALVFGSYTWPPFRASVGALNAMAEKYKGKVEFLLVYIREAHPTDGWVAPGNQKAGIEIAKAKNYEEKEGYASVCVRTLGIKFTTVVDKMDAKVESNYMGWPDRLYLVGKNGRIAWKGDPGPQGFKPPQLEAAIEAELRADGK